MAGGPEGIRPWGIAMKSFVLPLAVCAALTGCAAYVPADYATYPAYPAYPSYYYPDYGYAGPIYGGPVFGFSYFGGGGFRDHRFHRGFHDGFRGGDGRHVMGAGPGRMHGDTGRHDHR